MRRSWWSALILSGLIVGVALGASEPDVLERNRRLLDRWRADPDHYARLLRDLRAFHALPRERQEQLRRLDLQLHETDIPTQGRLWAALERYNVWLEALPEEQRQDVSHAADATVRLARIRELRSNEWLQRLPTRDQEAVALFPADQQADRIATLRFEDRRRRVEWYSAWLTAEASVPRPTKLSELPAETKAFVETNLLKRLNHVEREKLRKAEGQYPEWLRTLEGVSEAHPVFPPLPSGEIKTFEDVLKVLGGDKFKKGKSGWSKLKSGGQWPEYALMVRRTMNFWGEKNVPPLGASKPSDFTPEIQAFLKQQLYPVLNQEQMKRLERQEGFWPEYPKMLHNMANEHHLRIPGMSLPGPVEMWENARAEAVVPIDGLLTEFARTELTAEERAKLSLKSGDLKGNHEKIQNAFNRMKIELERKHKKGSSR